VPVVNGEHLLPVVVGVDGSGPARTAAMWAADEAARRHATLRIVHANPWPVVHPVGHYPIEYQRSILEYSQELVRESVTDASEGHPGLIVTSELVTTTPIELMLAESRDAQLIVLGSRGLGGFSGLLLGSVAMAAAGHGQCPLVVIRGTAPQSPPPRRRPGGRRGQRH
jgi:nucleotide-binding universal stress UspA family protein